MKIDPAAETPQELGASVLPYLGLQFLSHFQELESCTESFLLGMAPISEP